jgi:hypothetical protein
VIDIVLYIAMPLVAGVWIARLAPKVAAMLVLPLGLIATGAFLFLMWETRLLRRQAFNAVAEPLQRCCCCCFSPC